MRAQVDKKLAFLNSLYDGWFNHQLKLPRKCEMPKVLSIVGKSYTCKNLVSGKKATCKSCRRKLQKLPNDFVRFCDVENCLKSSQKGSQFCKEHTCQECLPEGNSARTERFLTMILCLKEKRIKVPKDLLKIIFNIYNQSKFFDGTFHYDLDSSLDVFFTNEYFSWLWVKDGTGNKSCPKNRKYFRPCQSSTGKFIKSIFCNSFVLFSIPTIPGDRYSAFARTFCKHCLILNRCKKFPQLHEKSCDEICSPESYFCIDHIDDCPRIYLHQGHLREGGDYCKLCGKPQ